MKLLYWLSYIPTAPFWALGWIFHGIAVALTYVGNWIHDMTTYRIWVVLHRRKCESSQNKR